MDINQANQKVVNKIMSARPMLTGLGLARDVVPDMKENLIMHAGPPIEWEKMSGPMGRKILGLNKISCRINIDFRLTPKEGCQQK